MTGSEGISIAYSLTHLLLAIERKTQVCYNCEHFRLHYTRAGNCMVALHCGHCCYPRMKDREVTDTCQHFQNKFQKEESE